MVIVAFNVEVYSSRTGAVGMMIMLLQTLGCMVSIGITVAFLQNLGQKLDLKKYGDSIMHLPCSQNEYFLTWNGMQDTWFLIEIAEYYFFFFTMLILLIKSRYIRIGSDQ